MLTVRIHEAVDFSKNEMRKLEEAIIILGQTVNSEHFKQKVLNHMYLGKKQFANNEGRTNEEIYNLLMSGKEVLTPEVDNEIDVKIMLYWSFKKVIGYTYPYTNMQWINSRYFNSDTFTACDIAANILHEYLHKQGWDHDFKATARRPYSVPYAIGNMVYNTKYLEHKDEL